MPYTDRITCDLCGRAHEHGPATGWYVTDMGVLCPDHHPARSVGEGGKVIIVDDDETDGTPLAHPAYWRGEAAGVWGVISALTDILDGKPRGTFGDSRLEALAVRIEALAAGREKGND